jgi:hypothetical protein
MQVCRLSKVLGISFAMLAHGCLSSGGPLASRSAGPSPSFGLNYVPRHSETSAEGAASGAKTTTRIDATDDLDAPTGQPSGKTGNKLVNWIASRDKEPPERKPLPLPLSSRAAATDDDQFEQ